MTLEVGGRAIRRRVIRRWLARRWLARRWLARRWPGRWHSRRAERGSATLWVLAAAAIVALTATAGVLRGSAVLARHRAEGAADLSALAAAAHIGVDGAACAAAAGVATANGAEVIDCTLHTGYDARSGTVLVRVGVPVRLFGGSLVVTASALAGRGVPP